jgi:ATP-dependent Clp protease adapter protein ClpS
MSTTPDRLPFSANVPLPNYAAAAEAKARRKLPPYRVVLLNNDDQDLMFVVRTIMELTRLCRAEATHKMWEAHHSGRAQLLITHKERAELYAAQFADRGLRTLVEPA